MSKHGEDVHRIMSEKEMLQLQNGSDVRGIAVEGVTGENVNLTPKSVNRIVSAFVDFLSEKTGKKKTELKIGVGHDSRITAESLKLQALMALTDAGAEAVDCRLASTPAMFMGCVYDETKFDGSMMITASHLPYNRNGLKFFDQNGGLEKADIKKILQIAAEKKPVCGDVQKRKRCDLIELYAKKLCDKIKDSIRAKDFDRPLDGMKIVVDAGNGAGGFFVAKILDQLGADTKGSLFLDPDGYFPNHVPNPENKTAMECLSNAVLKEKADLGLIFDTDVDRMSAVLSDGTFINKDALIAMMAAIAAETCPGGTIITDSVTSDELTEFLEEELGLRHHRFKRGYKNVINECKRLNKEAGRVVSPLAIETSGHGALAENYYLDDGAYLAVKLLIAAAKMNLAGKNIESLIEKMKPLQKNGEYRLKILAEDYKAYGEKILEEFKTRALERRIELAEPSYEGVRLIFKGDVCGWALLRMSLHDPVMPLNIQENRAGDYPKIVQLIKELLAGYEIDASALEKE